MEEQSNGKEEQTENQVEKSEPEVERREGESRIDYHIRTTRHSLKLDVFFASIPVQEVKAHSISEFGGGFSRGPIVRLYVWRVLKLKALYLAKAYMWLVRLIKRK